MMFVFDDVHFSGTRLRLIEGKLLDHASDGIYSSTNAQGVLAAGVAADLRRVAGAEVERELRAFQQLQLGAAYVTSPGHLEARGVRVIAHGVVVKQPGDSPTLDTTLRALVSGLQSLERAGCRSVTLPLVGSRIATLDHASGATAITDAVIGHLRRGSRLEQIAFVGADQRYLQALAAAFRRHAGVSSDSSE